MKAIVICLLFILITGCESGGGADKIYTIEGIKLELNGNDTGLITQNELIDIEFSVSDTLSERNGNSKKPKKDLPFIYENEWLNGSFNLCCNETLTKSNDTFKALTNLINTSATKSYVKLMYGQMKSDNKLQLTGIKPPVLNKEYTFYIKGTTNNNLTFTDSCTVFIK